MSGERRHEIFIVRNKSKRKRGRYGSERPRRRRRRKRRRRRRWWWWWWRIRKRRRGRRRQKEKIEKIENTEKTRVGDSRSHTRAGGYREKFRARTILFETGWQRRQRRSLAAVSSSFIQWQRWNIPLYLLHCYPAVSRCFFLWLLLLLLLLLMMLMQLFHYYYYYPFFLPRFSLFNSSFINNSVMINNSTLARASIHHLKLAHFIWIPRLLVGDIWHFLALFLNIIGCCLL